MRFRGLAPAGLALVAVAVGNGKASAVELADCPVADVEYAVSANLRIAGTSMGAGDGEHRVGPGKIVLRMRLDPAPESGSPSSVNMTLFELRQRFLVVAKVAFWTTRVLTDIETRASPDSRAVVAEGSLSQRSLRWVRVTGSFRDDGALTCDGFFCGKFGAPPAGKSEYHMDPPTMELSPFEFSPDMKTFSMRSTLATKTDDPQQESYIALAGREVRRTCVSGAPRLNPEGTPPSAP
jgi:hypothetical protein